MTPLDARNWYAPRRDPVAARRLTPSKEQFVWARLTCLEPSEACEGPGDGSTGDEGLSGMELGLAIGGGVAGGIALVGTVAYMAGWTGGAPAAAATTQEGTELFAGIR